MRKWLAAQAGSIDRLSSNDKRLLQAAAVIGRDLSFALLQAIAELPEAELRDGLTRLQGAEFLYETLFPELEYTFKHALTHPPTTLLWKFTPGAAPRSACTYREGH
jgi:predicted ATPase